MGLVHSPVRVYPRMRAVWRRFDRPSRQALEQLEQLARRHRRVVLLPQAERAADPADRILELHCEFFVAAKSRHRRQPE